MAFVTRNSQLTIRHLPANGDEKAAPPNRTRLRESLPQLLGDALHLGVGHLGEDRQSKHFSGGLLGLRERAFLVSQAGEAFLEMERDRIKDRRRDAPLRQPLANG